MNKNNIKILITILLILVAIGLLAIIGLLGKAQKESKKGAESQTTNTVANNTSKDNYIEQNKTNNTSDNPENNEETYHPTKYTSKIIDNETLKESVDLDNALFIYEYENYAWSRNLNGYIIYNDGRIEEFDVYNTEKTLKHDNLTKEELNEIKELSNQVDEELYENNMNMADAGTSVQQVYNSTQNKWVTLSVFTGSTTENRNEYAIELQEFIKDIEKKYISN